MFGRRAALAGPRRSREPAAPRRARRRRRPRRRRARPARPCGASPGSSARAADLEELAGGPAPARAARRRVRAGAARRPAAGTPATEFPRSAGRLDHQHSVVEAASFCVRTRFCGHSGARRPPRRATCQQREPDVPLQPSDVPGAGRARSSRSPSARTGTSNHEHVLQRLRGAPCCGSPRTAHYFAKPCKTLFNDIRVFFPMSAQHRVLPRGRDATWRCAASGCCRSRRRAST